MIPFSDWFPLAAVGVTFTTMGLVKIYGFCKSFVGGGDRPAACRLLGRCPSWSLRLNWAVTALFLCIGLVSLGILLTLLLKP